SLGNRTEFDSGTSGFAGWLIKPVSNAKLRRTLMELDSAMPAPPVPEPSAAPPSTPTADMTTRVLIVDDNATNQLVARLALQRLGCEVHVVSSGADAVQIVGREHFDIVFMDCEMPEMD